MGKQRWSYSRTNAAAMLFGLELSHVVGRALASWDWKGDSTYELLIAPALWVSCGLALEGRLRLAIGLAGVLSPAWWVFALGARPHADSLLGEFGWIPILNLWLMALGLSRLILERVSMRRLPSVPITPTTLPLAQAAYVAAFAWGLPHVAPLPILALAPPLLGIALLARAGRPALSEALAAFATVAWWCALLPRAPLWLYAREPELFRIAIFGWVPLLSVLQLLRRAARSTAEPAPRALLAKRDARLALVSRVARKVLSWELAYVLLVSLFDAPDALVILTGGPLLWLSWRIIGERRHLLGLVCGWGLLSAWWGLGLCAIPPRGCMMSDAPILCAWLPALNALLLGAGLLWVLPLALEAAWESARRA